jgi:type IV secretory pathway VirD2 relaxase
VRARLSRIVRRAPEVMVKVTGRARDPGHLAAHLSYITRNGELAAEGRDGWPLEGRAEVMELAADWTAAGLGDPRRRRTSPLSLGVILSMPAGTDGLRLRDSARAFAAATFGDRFDYLFVLHTDVGHPHVHLTVKALGDHGERLNPKKADLEAWRQGFARALRDHGVEAEATPRRARGVARKAERSAVRKLRERAEQGRGAMPEVRRQAYREAAQAAFGGDDAARVWERRTAARQAQVRTLYLAQARLLQASGDAEDRRMGAAVEAFVRSLAPPDSQRLALARELRAANRTISRPPDAKDRGR